MKTKQQIIADMGRRIAARVKLVDLLNEEIAMMRANILAIEATANGSKKNSISLKECVSLICPLTPRERVSVSHMLAKYGPNPLDLAAPALAEAAKLAQTVEQLDIRNSLEQVAADALGIGRYQGRDVARAASGKVLMPIDGGGSLRGRGNPAAKFETRDGPTQHRVGSHPSATARNMSRITAADDEMPSPTSGWTEEQWAAADALIMGWEPEPGTEE